MRRAQAKAEFLNPGGCSKDRVAKQIVLDAEAAGLLADGGTIVEGTSGSTGISLAMMAAGAPRPCTASRAHEATRRCRPPRLAQPAATSAAL